MPRQSNHGTQVSAWSFCDRCGDQFPLSEMTMQNGSLLCYANKCFDNPDSFSRDTTIKEVLSDPENEMQNMTALKRSDGADQNMWDDF